MALSPRRRQRRRPRMVLFGLVVTSVVLLANAAYSARDNGAARRLDELAYLDRVRPSVERSTAQGAAVAQVREQATRLGRDGVNRRMDRAAREAAALVMAVEDADPPRSLRRTHSLLVSTLIVRARAVSAMGNALLRALGTAPAESAADELARAAAEVGAADRTYQVFVDSLPRPKGLKAALLPASVWVADPAAWSQPELAAFVAALRASATLAPVHDVGVVSLSLEPTPVGRDGPAAVLPSSVKSLRLQVVVANTGNEPERKVTVLATLAGPAGQLDTARDFVDLDPGQRRTVTLGGLRPAGGGPSTLTVAIGPVEGESTATDNQRLQPLVFK